MSHNFKQPQISRVFNTAKHVSAYPSHATANDNSINIAPARDLKQKKVGHDTTPTDELLYNAETAPSTKKSHRVEPSTT
jgi:hypothetical protein